MKQTYRGDESEALLFTLPEDTLFWVLSPGDIIELWQVIDDSGRHCLVWRLPSPDDYTRSDNYTPYTTWEPRDTLLVPDEDGQTVLHAALATQWSDVLIAQARLTLENVS